MVAQRSITHIIATSLWRYTQGNRLKFVSLVTLGIASQSVGLAAPYALGQIVNTLQNQGHAGVEGALKWFLLLIGINLFETVLSSPAGYLELKLKQSTSHAFLKDFYSKNLALPLLWHQDQHSGSLISRGNKSSSALSTFIGAPENLAWVIIGFFGPIVVLLNIMPVIGMITLLISLLTVFLNRFFDTRVRKQNKLTNELNHQYFSAVTDYLSNIRTIIILRLGSPTRQDLGKRLGLTLKPYHKEVLLRQGGSITTQFFIQTTAASCIIYLLFQFKDNSMPLQIGTLVMVITYLNQMTGTLFNTSRVFANLVQAVGDFESMDVINKAYDEHISVTKANQTHLEDWSEIVIQDINFTYHSDRNVRALENLSFTFKRGEKIALVGASGGGKSTLMSVLRGLYPAQSGKAIIDGKLFETTEPLGSISTLIPQEPEIFENTIRYNITLGVEHSDEEILEACRIACFDSVLETLPSGLDSKINEKGVNLSGGQKQRLALARGIFAIQESSLVLFDEPTSSVDSMTERQMYQNLFAAFPDICLISSIHRLNLLNQFDTIWVMDQGKLVQQGSLMALSNDRDGAFYQLWSAYQQEEP